MNIRNLSFLIVSFFIGGMPFGYFIFKIVKNDDIRKYGSGNIGATNVGRLLGKKYAILTFLLDGLKGFFAVILSKYLFPNYEFMHYLSGFFAILGHLYSPYLKFKGGKGMATTVLVLFALNLKLGLIISLAWLLTFKITGISALSALISISIMTISSFFIIDIRLAIILLILTILIFFKHKDNIERLINNEELGFKK